MNIELQARITLTTEDIQEALTNYINDNGFDLNGKEVEFPNLPEEIVVTAAGEDLPKEATTKTASRSRAKPKTVQPKVDATVERSFEDHAQEQIDKAEADREALLEQERQKAEALEKKRAEAKAQAQELLQKGNEILEASKTQSVNPMASLTSVETDVIEDDEQVAEPLAGQDVLDAKPTEGVAEVKPRFNPFEKTADTSESIEVAAAAAVIPVQQTTPVLPKKSIFG